MKMSMSIRVQAQKKDLNQRQVAELSGLSRQTVNRFWRGKGVKAIDFLTLEKLAEVLDCSPLDFLYVTENTD